jgi:hypothetical protein
VREAKAKRAEEIEARRVQLQDDQYTIAKKAFDAIATSIAASDLKFYKGDADGRQNMADRLAYRLRALATALQCATAQMYQALTPSQSRWMNKSRKTRGRPSPMSSSNGTGWSSGRKRPWNAKG